MPTALITVSDKEGITDFGRKLVSLGWDIIASAGTARALSAAGVPARDVAEIVGGGPILGHSVVTLSREVAAGVLAREDQRKELERLGIPWIDMVDVGFYPFEKEVARPGATRESIVEMIDIGGPTLLSEAAKRGRIAVSDPAQRSRVLQWLGAGKPNEEEFIADLAWRAEAAVVRYRLAVARFLSGGKFDGFLGELFQVCTYGENRWQKPARHFRGWDSDPMALHNFTQLEGKAPSYNNLCDLDRMLQTVTHVAIGLLENCNAIPYIAVADKHGNPCGAVAVGDSPLQCLQMVTSGDPIAIHGGMVMTGFPLDDTLAGALVTCGMPDGSRRLLDGVAAPDFTQGAINILRRKSGECLLWQNPCLECREISYLDLAARFRYVRGGFLMQPNYTHVYRLDDPDIEVVGDAAVLESPALRRDLSLAWAIGATSNSNTITLVRDGQLLGNGVGQQDRVFAGEIAVRRAHRANHSVEGAVAYTDSFFPFPDGVEVLADAGVKYVIGTKGSVNDPAVKKAMADRGITAFLLPDAKARGFFGH